jgi:acetoin utilization protein AcuB
MFVKERMTPDPVTGHPDMSVMDAQDLMKSKGFRHLPIVDESDLLIGLVTRRTLATALPSDTSNLSRFEISYILDQIKVRSVMIEDVICAEPDMPIEIAARIMADEQISGMPVMDGNQLVGIITDNDLFNTMVSLLGARNPGIRVTVLQPDRTGEVARLTTAIANAGGYLSVSVGYYPEDIPDHWVSVCKVQNITQEELIDVINKLEDTAIQDIRQFQETT